MEIDLPFDRVTGLSPEFKWVKVWHNSNPSIWPLKEDVEGLVETWPSMFKPVAVISGKNVNLDVAWRATNSVDFYWGDLRGDLRYNGHRYKVKVLSPTQRIIGAMASFTHRSSMVGDIFETHQQHLFVIMSMGFMEVPHPTRVARIPRDQLPLYLNRNPIANRMIEKILKS